MEFKRYYIYAVQKDLQIVHKDVTMSARKNLSDGLVLKTKSSNGRQGTACWSGLWVRPRWRALELANTATPIFSTGATSNMMMVKMMPMTMVMLLGPA